MAFSSLEVPAAWQSLGDCLAELRNLRRNGYYWTGVGFLLIFMLLYLIFTMHYKHYAGL